MPSIHYQAHKYNESPAHEIRTDEKADVQQPEVVHQPVKHDPWAGTGRCFNVLREPGLFDRKAS